MKMLCILSNVLKLFVANFQTVSGQKMKNSLSSFIIYVIVIASYQDIYKVYEFIAHCKIASS